MGTNLTIPVIAAGAFIGYHIDSQKIRGAVIGAIFTFVALIYADMKLWNSIGEKAEIITEGNTVIEPEYEVLNDE